MPDPDGGSKTVITPLEGRVLPSVPIDSALMRNSMHNHESRTHRILDSRRSRQSGLFPMLLNASSRVAEESISKESIGAMFSMALGENTKRYYVC